VVDELGVSQRQACRVIGQHRSTQRKPKTPRSDEDALTILAIQEPSTHDITQSNNGACISVIKLHNYNKRSAK
jgi:hypothetical protein